MINNIRIGGLGYPRIRIRRTSNSEYPSIYEIISTKEEPTPTPPVTSDYFFIIERGLGIGGLGYPRIRTIRAANSLHPIIYEIISTKGSFSYLVRRGMGFKAGTKQIPD
jgi:hypothetical protein